MKMTKPLIQASLVLLLSAGLSAAGVYASDDAVSDKAAQQAPAKGELYLPSESAMADLRAGFDAARESNRLALVVMGANWCHDSRALAARLYEQPLSTIISQYYEIIFVDVGYLDKGKDVITSLGIPVYYATPTVLIVDPVNSRVINAFNRNQWGDAASISMEESVDYFAQFAQTDRDASQSDDTPDENLKKLLADIEVFEQVQAARLYEAYAVLTPMLRAYKEGDKQAFSETIWNEVRDYRYQVSADVLALRAEAGERSAAGETGIKLEYPVYPAFSWESQ